MFVYFTPQSEYCLCTWSPGDVLLLVANCAALDLFLGCRVLEEVVNLTAGSGFLDVLKTNRRNRCSLKLHTAHMQI